MTTQPKYYVGIAECGCVMAFIEDRKGNRPSVEHALKCWDDWGYRTETKDVKPAYCEHTCGKDGAK